MPRKLRENPMQWSSRRERGKCTIHSSRSKGKFEVSFIWRSEGFGEPDALFSSEQGKLIRSFVFRNANPSNLRGSLHEGNKDHLLNQARSVLAKQEVHAESLNKCTGERQRQTEEQWRTNTDLLNLDENKFDYKKNCLWKKKFSEILKCEICTKWEKLRERRNFE